MTVSGERYSPIEMLRLLVSFDTVSDTSNLGLIRFVEEYLKGHGVDPRVSHNADGTKANLFATIGPDETRGGVILSGHTDVVPAEPEAWTTNPFEVVRRDGRLYGRGTADMKGFIACALASVPDFLERRLRSPIHLALTYDEEITCEGAMQLVDELRAQGLAPEAVIIGEPTELRVINAHKGHYAFETTVVGREAHASLTHRGVNAIALAARLVEFLRALGEELAERAEPLPGLEPPYTTINVGTISGGTGFNIVPSECRFHWETRPTPSQPVDDVVARFEAFARELEAEMRRADPNAGIYTRRTLAVPGFAPEDSPAARLVMSLARTNETWATPFGTEAPCYQAAGMPVVIFGPGSIDHAHKPDEFISVEHVDACVDFLGRLSARLAERVPG